MGMLITPLAFIVLAFGLFSGLAMSTGYYQHFKFVVQWPPAHCAQRHNPCHKIPQLFTIHGLWPSNNTPGIYQRSICQGSGFIKPTPQLEAKLNISWPNVESRNNTKFWELEWDRHGKCSEQTYKQTQYFKRSHDIWMKYNITKILNDGNIVSGTMQLNYSQIAAPLMSKLPKTPVLRCRRPQRGVQWLHEVALCWDHGGTIPVDCNINDATCDNTTLIDVL